MCISNVQAFFLAESVAGFQGERKHVQIKTHDETMQTNDSSPTTVTSSKIAVLSLANDVASVTGK